MPQALGELGRRTKVKGNISLKDFILGVKKELQDASAEGAKNPFLELNQVELEAVFGLETAGRVEGGFSVFVKAEAKVDASQSHKVKLIFSPIRSNFMFDVAQPDPTDQTPGEIFGPLSGSSPRQGSPKPSGPFFNIYPGVRIVPEVDVDEIIRRAVGETVRVTNLKGGNDPGSGQDGM
jgi:hypothetical protein